MSGYNIRAEEIQALNNTHWKVWRLLEATLEDMLGSLQEPHDAVIRAASEAQQNPNNKDKHFEFRNALTTFYKGLSREELETLRDKLNDKQRPVLDEVFSAKIGWRNLVDSQPKQQASDKPCLHSLKA